MSQMSREDVLQLIPAYVLDALDENERHQVEVLLTVDSEAQAILQQYRQIEAVLPLTVIHRQPSPDLKEKLLQRLHQNDEAPYEPDNLTALPEKPKRTPPRRPLIVSIAAMLVLAVIGLAFLYSNISQRMSPQAIFYELYQQQDADRIVVEAGEDSPSDGELIISADGKRAAIRVRELPEIDADQGFQLWLVDENDVVDGGVYQLADNYTLYIIVPNEQPIYNYLRMGISIEPASGSPLGNRPTGDNVFRVTIPADDSKEQKLNP